MRTRTSLQEICNLHTPNISPNTFRGQAVNKPYCKEPTQAQIQSLIVAHPTHMQAPKRCCNQLHHPSLAQLMPWQEYRHFHHYKMNGLETHPFTSLPGRPQTAGTSTGMLDRSKVHPGCYQIDLGQPEAANAGSQQTLGQQSVLEASSVPRKGLYKSLDPVLASSNRDRLDWRRVLHAFACRTLSRRTFRHPATLTATYSISLKTEPIDKRTSTHIFCWL